MSTKTFKDLLTADDVLSEVKDEVEKKLLLKVADVLGEKMEDFIGEAVTDRLAELGYAKTREREIDRKYRTMLEAWRNNGRVSAAPGEKITIKDMIARDSQRVADSKSGKLKPEEYVTHDANDTFWQSPALMPRVVSTLVREAAEPVYVLSQLFQEVRMSGPPQAQLLFPAVSAAHAGDLDMGPQDRFPEQMLEMAGTVTATIGKCGIKIRATEEMLEWSQYDIWNMHLRAAGVSLARWKENKCSKAIVDNGLVQYDNSSSSPSDWTHGRDANLLFNGTFALQDLHDSYSAMLNDGYVPDVLLLNPMAWTIFAQDPTMRNWAYAQAAAGGIWQKVRGEVASIKQWMQGLNGTTVPDDPTQIQTTYTDIPQLFPYPLRLIVSPFLPYDPTDNTTTMILADSSEIGIKTVASDIRTLEWEEIEREIRQLAMYEKYAINILNEGRALRQIRNVILARSYDIDDKVHLQHDGPIPTGRSFSL